MEVPSDRSNHALRFNYSHESKDRLPEPDYPRRYGAPSPPLTAYGNIQYRGFIKTLKDMWADAHPEIYFRPFSDNNEYDPDRGYIIHSIAQKVPKEGNAKPRAHHNFRDEVTGKYWSIFVQSFVHTVRFFAVHTDAEIADELIDEFEDFMTEVIPVFKAYGLEELIYYQRIADTNQNRMGDDVAVRSIDYRLTTQKILQVENATLNKYFVRLVLNMGEQATPNTVELPFQQ